MNFVFDSRTSESPFVETVWHTHSEGGSFIAAASNNLEMVITQQKDSIRFTLRGPETKASTSPVPEDAEIFGISFKLGTFLPHLPTGQLLDMGIDLPKAGGDTFWLQGAAWEFPTFENADTFIARLMHEGLLAHEPIVEAALQGETQATKALSLRSVQRRFLRATGLSHKAIYQTQRARQAMRLLQQGVSILDTVEQAGYYDQPHLTRALKYLMGQTPAEILRAHQVEQITE